MPPTPVNGNGWIWPLAILHDERKPVISQGFGKRSGGPKTGTHNGVDLTYLANEGDGGLPKAYKGKYTPSRAGKFFSPLFAVVLAVQAGVVIATRSVTSSPVRGQVYIKHADGRVTRYAHLSLVAVGLGQKVRRGEILGIMGAGAGTPFRHLHFELFNKRPREGGKQLDPAPSLRAATHESMRG